MRPLRAVKNKVITACYKHRQFFVDVGAVSA